MLDALADDGAENRLSTKAESEGSGSASGERSRPSKNPSSCSDRSFWSRTGSKLPGEVTVLLCAATIGRVGGNRLAVNWAFPQLGVDLDYSV